MVRPQETPSRSKIPSALAALVDRVELQRILAFVQLR